MIQDVGKRGLCCLSAVTPPATVGGFLLGPNAGDKHTSCLPWLALGAALQLQASLPLLSGLRSVVHLGVLVYQQTQTLSPLASPKVWIMGVR